MKIIPHPDISNDYLFELDNSSLELLTTCPRAAYHYCIRRRELVRSSIALNFGSLMHTGWEIRMHGGKDWEAKQRQTLTALAPELLHSEFDDHRDLSYALYCMELYNSVWPSFAEPFDIVSVDNVPLIEVPFSMGLGKVTLPDSEKNVHVVFKGKIDAVVKQDGLIYILDHKTTSIDSSSFFNDFVLSSQVYGYREAVSSLWNLDVYGFYLDALITRKRPQRSGKGPECRRQRYPFVPALAAEWRKDVFAHVETFLGYWLDDYFPKAPKWCQGKYGQCQYFDVCSLGAQEMREMMLTSDMYRDVTWDPGHKEVK